MWEGCSGRTTTIRSHSRRTHRIVLIEAALLDELLRHDIAGGEEYLYRLSYQPIFCIFIALFVAADV